MEKPILFGLVISILLGTDVAYGVIEVQPCIGNDNNNVDDPDISNAPEDISNARPETCEDIGTAVNLTGSAIEGNMSNASGTNTAGLPQDRMCNPELEPDGMCNASDTNTTGLPPHGFVEK
jgi:hypothetical protein